MKNPFNYFDAVYCINLRRRKDRWIEVKKSFEQLGIADSVIHFYGIETPENGHIGCMLSHREIIKEAKRKNFNCILVFEDDLYIRYEKEHYARLINSLSQIDNWFLFYFGGCLSPIKNSKIHKINNYISKVSGMNYAHAIAYSKNMYDIFLDEIPSKNEKVKIQLFLKKWKFFDSWLAEKQNTCLALVDNMMGIFQNRKSSDTDGNQSIKSYIQQYLYLFYGNTIIGNIFLCITKFTVLGLRYIIKFFTHEK